MNYNSRIILTKSSGYLLNENLIIQFSKAALDNGCIENSDLFIKEYLAFFKANKKSTFFFRTNIQIIYEFQLSVNDQNILQTTFANLNYKHVELISNSSFVNLNLKDNYLLINKYLHLFFLDKYNTKKVITIDPNLSINEINSILTKRCFKKNLIVIGSISNLKILNNINYYVYNNYLDFFKK